jgi:hypothetical protein
MVFRTINMFIKMHYQLVIAFLIILCLLLWLFLPSPYYNLSFYRPKKKLLIISSNIDQLTYEKDIEPFLLPNVVYKYYSYDTIKGYLEILDIIKEAIDKEPYDFECVGIMYHTHTPDTLQLFKNDKSVVDTKEDKTKRDQFDTFKICCRCIYEMGKQCNKGYSISNFDLISCRVLPQSGKTDFKSIRQESKILVSASIDTVGTGTSWFLEEGARNLVGIYFNESIYNSQIKLIA